MKFSHFLDTMNNVPAKPFVVEAPFLRSLQEDAGEADGTEYFDPEAVQRAYKQNPASRETVIHLSPDEFLALANELREPNPTKEEKVANALQSGSKLSDLPYLTAVTGADGNLYIDGHEGRHRMMALKKLGVRLVPVVLLSGEGGDQPSFRWGNTDKRPQTITGQDDRATIAMPKIQTF